MSRRSPVALLLLAALLCQPAPARAETSTPGEEAVRLGHDGLALYQQGKWLEALQQLEQAVQAMYSPVFVLYIARCERNLGRLRAAVARLEGMLARPKAADEPLPWRNAGRDAQAELEALRGNVPGLRIEGAGLTSVSVDGTPARVGELIRVDPGDHLIRGWSIDGRLASKQLSLAEGDRDVRVELSFRTPEQDEATANQRPAPPASPSQSQDARPHPFKTAAWITGGAAVASALLGTVTGIVAMTRTNSIQAQCDGSQCPKELQDDADEAQRWANVSTAAFAVAGVNAAFSVTFVLLLP